MSHRLFRIIWICFASLAFTQTSPDVLIISVDTLRADHLSGYGYSRKTSPNIDELMSRGVVFTQARTPEPLTAPAMISMLTSRYPHEHGASRNGLAHRSELPSLPRFLKGKNYATSAIIGNWTLKNRLTKLGEHFGEYHEVLERKRWWGLFLAEANAQDITDRSLQWLGERDTSQPYFLWVHYADPHAPYQMKEEQAKRMGLTDNTRVDRYDSEIAFTDYHIGRLLDGLPRDRETLILFCGDHGESLGERGYWGHGRHLFEPTLRIPMAIIWEGRLTPRQVEEPANLLDVAPTFLGLLKLPVPGFFRGIDWTPILDGKHAADPDRVTFYQAHRGAVQTRSGAQTGRERGLLEVGLIAEGHKEIYRIRTRTRKLFHLDSDPTEMKNLVKGRSIISPELESWARQVDDGLKKERREEKVLTEADVEMLRSLGYIE